MASVNNLASEIARQLQQYSNRVEEEVQEAADEVTKEAVKEIKENSRVLTGLYKKGWTRKKVGNSYIIHNKTDYQLTHLLEKGHVIANGTGRSRSFPHIRPAEEKAVREYLERVERAIRQ